MNLLMHSPKSKSTLDMCDHNVSCPLALEIRGALLNPLLKRPTQLMLADAVGKCDPFLLNEMTSSRIYKTMATVSVTSLHSLTSINTGLSRESGSTVNGVGTQSAFKRLFITNLKSPLQHIYILERLEDALKLLERFYTLEANSLPDVDEVFPYLHGLKSRKQRVFFDKTLNLDPAINEEMATTTDLRKFDAPRFHCDVKPPEKFTNGYFHLMFVCPELNQPHQLINTIHIDELLSQNPRSNACPHRPFSHINDTGNAVNDDALNNRNFKDQIKLMAPMADFFVYGAGNHTLNLAAAKNIALCCDNRNKVQNVFVLNLPDWENGLSKYMAATPEYGLGGAEMSSTGKLLQWEQRLIWNHNSMKWLHPNICLGTLVDFDRLTHTRDDTKAAGGASFALYISCEQDAPLPDLAYLDCILSRLKEQEHVNPIHLKFPASGCLNTATITFEETLSFLNALKIIHLFALTNKNVFVFCHDGFTGLSLLSISLKYLLGLNTHSTPTMESVLLETLSDGLKFYFFESDLVFWKSIEKFICWMHSHRIYKTGGLVRCTERPATIDFDLILSFHYKDIVPYTTVACQNWDWFKLNNDNNFPSRILETLYLGSVNHASSTTLLNATRASRLISLGEKPQWFSRLKGKFVFEHEVSVANPANGRCVIKPIHSAGLAKVYVVKLNSIESSLSHPLIPHLRQVVYIHNLKDDGKDSLLSLLVDAPTAVRDQILVDPCNSSEITFVHCRIGVSRSATLVIAIMMKYMQMLLLQSYMFVRVQRFNIIIQPNLRLFYELFKFEEHLKAGKGSRTVSWDFLCNEVSKLNCNYIRSN